MRPSFIVAIIVSACVAAALGTAPTSAASQNTARASSDLRVYAGPGTRYGVIGTLPADTPVHLSACTYRQRWCLFTDSTGKDSGWVRGAYLIGSAAKLEVTRDTDFMRHFLNPLPFSEHGSKSDR